MKFTPALVLLALVAFLPGCMTNAQFESSELTAAGFKAVEATTPAQEAHLKTLPQGKISKVPRNGKTYFVYPDPSTNTLYVGRQAEYDAFQRNQVLAVRRAQYVMESQNTFVGDDAYLESFSTWGPWEGIPWGS